jgi:hypothetical protein
MVSPNDEEARLSQNPRQKVVTPSDLHSKLVRWIDRRVDVPAELFLRRGKSMHDVLKRGVADNQKIDVARGA